MKILNLYAGIGGNRKLWSDKHNVTAVEWDEDKSKVYRDYFLEDKVVETDAHKYLKNNHKDFDFIWASPPCPTHSSVRKMATKRGQNEAKYPDMKLYQEVLLLKHYFNGDWVVENVDPYYEPLIKPQKSGRHCFWSNFAIPDLSVKPSGLAQTGETIEKHEERLGFDLSSYDIGYKKKLKMLRNCVDQNRRSNSKS